LPALCFASPLQKRKKKRTSPTAQKCPLQGLFLPPFPFPSGEAIRRHVARGAGFKPSPLGERGSLRLRQGYPYGTLRVALTQSPLKKQGIQK